MAEYQEAEDRLRVELAGLLERDDEVRSAMRRKDPDGKLSFEDLGVEGEFDDVLDSLGDRSRTELLDIWNALQRIKQGTYGTCSECGQKISAERLEAMPATEYCLECALKLERQEGRA